MAEEEPLGAGELERHGPGPSGRQATEMARLQEQMADLTRQLESLCEKHRLQTLELKQATTELDRLEISAAANASLDQARRVEISALAQQLAESRKQLARLEKEKRGQLAAAERANKALRNEVQKQERLIAILSRSTSYRLGNAIVSGVKAMLLPVRLLRRHLLSSRGR